MIARKRNRQDDCYGRNDVGSPGEKCHIGTGIVEGLSLVTSSREYFLTCGLSSLVTLSLVQARP